MKKSLLLALAYVASTQISVAQEVKFSALDSNNDGQLSVEEAAADASLSAVFASLDKDKNGYLTPSELAEQ